LEDREFSIRDVDVRNIRRHWNFFAASRRAEGFPSRRPIRSVRDDRAVLSHQSRRPDGL